MKLIHLISGGDVGGAKTHVHTLLQGLSQTENVRLVCFTDGPFAQEAAALGIPTQVLTGRLRRIVRTLRDEIRREGYALVHCHGARANLVGSLLKKKTGVPVVTTVHSDYRLDYMGRPLAAMTYGVINRIALRRLDDWIGVSDVTAQMLVERGFDPNRVFTIVNGVPFDDRTPKQSREEFLRACGIVPDAETVVFGIAARINPVKDMETLIRAFAETVKACPAARLIIAGDGEQRAFLEELAKQLCPQGTVVFAGWLEDTDSFYAAIDVNMLTSLSEGLPYALPEGGRWSCATIASRVGGIPSLIEHENTGLLFTPKDVETLSKHMIRLAKDAELRRELGQRLYEKTKRSFSVEATVALQKKIYGTILRRHALALEGRRSGTLICGAYGKGNSGDDAILSAITAQLRRLEPDMPVYVTSRTPRQTARDLRIGAYYTFNMFGIHRRMKKTALYLSGGGSLIQDATSSRSLWYYLGSIRSAKKRGNKVMMFSCSVGPVRRKANRRRAGKTINRWVDSITLRDESSIAELRGMGVRDVPIRVTADMAFLMDPAESAALSAYLRDCGVKEDGSYLLVAPRPWQEAKRHIEDFAAAARHAHKTHGLTPILFAMEPDRDRAICAQIAQQLEGVPSLTLEAPENAALALGLMRHVRAVLGMRLHSLIFAASQGTPVVGVAYDPKVSGFFDYLGQDSFCTLPECTAARLIELLDKALSRGPSFAEQAAKLRTLAEENCRVAAELLKS